MDCYKPGEVLILPHKGGAEGTMGLIFESFNEKVELLYSVEDLLRFYHLPEKDLIEQFGSLPYVVRIPEGKEVLYAQKIRSVSNIKVSIPNYYIHSLCSKTEINTDNLRKSIDFLNCHVVKPWYGEGVKIAIFDTGVDPNVLPNPEKLIPVQLTTDKKPQSPYEKDPHDPIGHGSTVAYIINSISPSSTILSVKIMESMGTVGSLISGIFLAEAEFKPDIYNLSLRLSCDPDVCDVCGHDRNVAVNSYQLRLLFDLLDKRAGNRNQCNPLIVAAAGNGGDHITMPASFPNVLAVGSYDMESNNVAHYSDYNTVPENRYILAPGGFKDSENCIAFKKCTGWERQSHFYGTSFSAAFVSAVSARYLCTTKDSTCKEESGYIGDRTFVMDCLRASSRRNLEDINPKKLGMGVLYYDCGAIKDYLTSLSKKRFLSKREKFIQNQKTTKDKIQLNIENIFNILREMWPEENKRENESFETLFHELQKFSIKDSIDLEHLILDQYDCVMESETKLLLERINQIERTGYVSGTSKIRTMNGVFYTYVGLTRQAMCCKNKNLADKIIYESNHNK